MATPSGHPSASGKHLVEEVGVLIAGGGNAGISLAARLLRHGVCDIAIIEPAHVHTYRPLLNYVGSGLLPLSHAQRSQETVIPRGARWIDEAVESVDPDDQLVQTTSGRRIRYQHLVVCPGSTPDLDRLPGSAEALQTAAGVTTFIADSAERAWQQLSQIDSGKVVFVLADPGGPCPETALKVVMLACDRWARFGVLNDLDLTVVTTRRRGLTGLEPVDGHLENRCRWYGIRLIDHALVDGIDTDRRQVLVQIHHQVAVLDYDVVFIVPPYRAPEWISAAGLATADGYMQVDARTLRHRRYDNVWGCGDAADANCARSGGALRKQTAVLASNLRQVLAGGTPSNSYDGYSVLPVVTTRGRAMVVEFDRTGIRTGMRGKKKFRPSRWAWMVDRYVLPQMYWRLILKGR